LAEKYSCRAIDKYIDGRKEKIKDFVVKEFPLTLFVNGREIVTMVCTPENLEELGVGFLLSEGFIRSCQHITEMECQKREGLLRISLGLRAAKYGQFFA
jgi:FdhD protein